MANLSELSDLCTPWCVHCVSTLRIAEHIEAGTGELGKLASAAGCDALVLASVLRHLIGKGVFQEPERGRFALNEAARELLEPGAHLGLDLDGLGGRMAYAWGTLMTSLRTGRPGYAEVFGLPFWEDLNAHPGIGEEFDALIGPQGHGLPNPNFPLTGGWESVNWVVDVGGGTGAMLTEILKARPNVKGTLVDLPRTMALAGELIRDAGVEDRVTRVGQSFFEPLPAGADLYLLKGILNDWPDGEAVAILRCCTEAAAGSGGRVVVLGGAGEVAGITIETVLVGGRQRSPEEMAEMARVAGLDVVSCGRPLNYRYFVMECRVNS